MNKINEGQIDSPSNVVGSENPAYHGDANIANVSTNLSAEDMFQQVQFPSIARQICSVVKVNGTTGAVFNIRQKDDTNDVEIVRRNFELVETNQIKTGMTLEVIQDIKNTFGADATKYVGTLLRSLANNYENQKVMKYLKDTCVDRGSIDVQNTLTAEAVFFNITLKIHQCILEANSKNARTYSSWAVIPYKCLASVVGLGTYVNGEFLTGSDNSLAKIKIGLTEFFINPDPSDDNVYVGLKSEVEPSKSSLFFGDMACHLYGMTDPNNGQTYYSIWDRFGVTASPLHEDKNPMLFKFKVTGIVRESTDVNTVFNNTSIDTSWKS